MMDKFRNLSNNIFFKIFLGFVGLTFIMFGVSSFILGSRSSWIAKVGGKTISYDQFIKVAQSDKEAIYRANHTPEALKYLESPEFKQGVLGRMITKNLIQSLQEEFQIYPNRDLILGEIAANPGLKGKDGKFDRNMYQNFLQSNGLSEKQHISDLANEIVGGMIVQSFSEVPSVNQDLVKDLYQNRFETRTADLITISAKNIGTIQNPNEFELNAFFEKNKEQFFLPELRKVSFVSFGASALKQKIVVSDEEIEKEYQKNKSDYQIPETRNFSHILLSGEKEAQDFLASLKSEEKDVDHSKLFDKLAADKGKDKSTVLLQKISKKDLPKDIAESAFSLAKNQYSEVLKSPLGFHIFYLSDINPSSEMALALVKDKIKAALLLAKEDSQIQDQLKAIDDEILATNSIEKVATKFGFNLNKNLQKFDSKGLDSKKEKLVGFNNLEDFIKNSFVTGKGRVSKILFSKANNQYYIIAVDEVEEVRQRSLDEVKVLASDLWIKDKKQQELKKLADSIAKKINQNPENVSAIVAQNGLKITQKRQFPRFYMIDAGDGRKVPYADQLLNDIFSVTVNQATIPHQTNEGEMVIAFVRALQSPAFNEQAIKMMANDLQKNFQNDILVTFNQYVTKRFPVEINQKLMQTSDKVADEQ